MIETKIDFLKIGREMLFRNLMVASNNQTLDQRPRALYGISVNPSIHPFRSMFYSFVLPWACLSNLAVAGEFISIDRSHFRGNLFLHDF